MTDTDLKAQIETLAKTMALPIAPEYMPVVQENFALIIAMAKFVSDFPLDESEEPAAVFTPR